jgi:hypothetical protein
MSTAILVRLLLWLWFGGAVALGYWQVLPGLPPLGLPALILALAALATGAMFRFRALRDWATALDLRTLVLVHVVRLVGIYFLFLYQDGELPRAFAIPAGVSEIVIGVMALPVALAPLEESARLRAVRIWGVVGFINLLFVVFTLARLNLTAPLHLRALATLPLNLYPAFLLPFLLTSAVLVLHRAGLAARAS